MNYNRFFWKPQSTAAFREAQIRGNFWAPTGCEVTDGSTSVPTAGPASEETWVTPFKKHFQLIAIKVCSPTWRAGYIWLIKVIKSAKNGNGWLFLTMSRSVCGKSHQALCPSWLFKSRQMTIKVLEAWPLLAWRLIFLIPALSLPWSLPHKGRRARSQMAGERQQSLT